LTKLDESCCTLAVPPDGTKGLRGFAELATLLEQAARRFGTPVYVVDLDCVAWAAQNVEAAFPPPWICQYSLKANDLPAIISFLARRGWGADVVSAGEWQHARGAGLANGAISFEGIGKTGAQLEYAVAEAAAGRPLRWLAVESPQEAQELAALAGRYRLGTGSRPPLDVLVRLNPGVSPETRPELAVGTAASKFGMSAGEIRALARGRVLAVPGLRLRGIHVHVGSELGAVRAWADAGVRATGLAAELARHASTIDTVDYGGGFPLPAPGAPAPARFREALTAGLAARRLDLPARPVAEPGRYLVGAAGWLVSSVLHVRNRRDANHARAGSDGRGQALVVIDAGMTEFIRPALYGARHRVHALPATGRAGGPEADTMLEGAVCESADSFGVHRLPPLRRGDLVAIEAAGAYAASFTSRYNGRPQPAEALIMPDGSLRLATRPPVPPARPAPAAVSDTGWTAPSFGACAPSQDRAAPR
jgi:diaminopimelate decarboxylase